MTADEIRKSKLSEAEAFREIAAQLAELNEHVERGVPVQLVGAAATDVHGLFYALAAFAKRKGKQMWRKPC